MEKQTLPTFLICVMLYFTIFVAFILFGCSPKYYKITRAVFIVITIVAFTAFIIAMMSTLDNA